MQRVANMSEVEAGVIIMSFKRWIICCSWTYFKINCFSSSSSTILSSAHNSHNTTHTVDMARKEWISHSPFFKQLITHIIHMVLVLELRRLFPCSVCCWLTKHVNVVIISFPEIFFHFFLRRSFFVRCAGNTKLWFEIWKNFSSSLESSMPWTFVHILHLQCRREIEIIQFLIP